MTNTEIKNTMKVWYKAYVERNDDSYFELYKAFHTMKAANLITDKQWEMIYNYDRKLSQEMS